MKVKYYLTGCLIVGIGTIFLLNFTQIESKDELVNNGFQRLLGSVSLSDQKAYDLTYNSYYLAGISKDQVYMGNVTAPGSLLTADYALKTTLKKVPLNIPKDKKLPWGIIRTAVDSPHVFIYERLTPTLFRGELPGLQYSRSHFNGIRFSTLTPIYPSLFAMRSVDRDLKQNKLQVVSLNSSKEEPRDSSNLVRNSYVLEKQVDGIFCTDGITLFNKELNQLIYIFFYRNQYVGLDTDLNVLYKGNTIDTISHANIQVSTISSGNRATLTSRPTVVNQRAATYGDRLYVQSNLIADNEDPRLNKKNHTIDVYSLTNNNYLHSFYIPKFKGENLRDFRVHNNNIVALQGRYLITYELSLTTSDQGPL